MSVELVFLLRVFDLENPEVRIVFLLFLEIFESRHIVHWFAVSGLRPDNLACHVSGLGEYPTGAIQFVEAHKNRAGILVTLSNNIGREISNRAQADLRLDPNSGF